MSVLSYDQLIGDKGVTGSIRHWMNNSLVPSEVVVDEALAWIFNSGSHIDHRGGPLRVRQMKKVHAETLATGASTVALPADYLDMIWIGRTGDDEGKLSRKSESFVEVRRSRGWEGCPSAYWTDEATVYFDMVADKPYDLGLVYFAEPAPLDYENPTNFLTRKYPRLLRAACLAFAYEWDKDAEERDRWLAIAESEIIKANVASDQERSDIEVDMDLGVN